MAQSDSGTQAVLEPPRRGLYRRFFAWLLSRLQRHYGDEIDGRKRSMLGAVHGTVVEVGVGAGANLPLYPPGLDLVFVEPNAHMRPYLEDTATQLGIPLDVRAGTAERMDVADGVADFVVSTLVLCSVDDQPATLREIQRVLKPGGTFLFLEHVAAPRGTPLRRRQERLRRLWRAIGDGCTLDRETWANIEAAGFEEVQIEHFEADTFEFAKPHIAGSARRP